MALLKALGPYSIALVFTVFHLGQACKPWLTQRCPSYYLIARVNLLAFVPENELDKFCGQIQTALQCVYSRGYMSGCGAAAMIPFDTMKDSASALCIHRTEEYRQSTACFTQRGVSDRIGRNCMVQMTNHTLLRLDRCGVLTRVPNCAKDVISMTDGCTPQDARLMRDMVRIYLNASRRAFGSCPEPDDKDVNPSPNPTQSPTRTISKYPKVQVSTVQNGKNEDKFTHNIDDGLTVHPSVKTDQYSSMLVQSSTSTQDSIHPRKIEPATAESKDRKLSRRMTSPSPEWRTSPQTLNLTRIATRTTNTEMATDLGVTGEIMPLESKSTNQASTVYLGTTILVFQALLSLFWLLW